MKKYITIGSETFTIVISKTTITSDAYNKAAQVNHTWTVEARQGETLLSTDKTRNEDSVLQLVRNAHDFIEKCACKNDASKTLEQKLSEMGFN